jgi:hypothetical protein
MHQDSLKPLKLLLEAFESAQQETIKEDVVAPEM